jgi:preprotein translocase subunit SecG
MYTFITVLIIVICGLLGAVVLIQNPKGGTLTPAFSAAGNELLGARSTYRTVERLTWGFAIGLILLSLSTAFFI